MKLFLHAGTHKTGTTAIQSFAAKHRFRLRRRGLTYPGYFPLLLKRQDAHHWLAHALAENENIPLSANSVRALSKRWLHRAQRKRASILISAEALRVNIDDTST